ncbi:uncharacterized protein CC84DRAFT_389610 [Paraphaeosphaeria sporulosa]|uniref:Uncharacterized protein n=1 Tax=Paraphaeosphaeria sporulosa TaxID=1460663 RepID=A0A177BVZ4_9PLEO|nr:uncharacterized protein CC84DRAFT_389610 [Paraphaeosphaeria sporulosa]OAF99285.1 hypothetical protein CC84DRAFT_389610 [Paraphaeosphaeria sporulosa]
MYQRLTCTCASPHQKSFFNGRHCACCAIAADTEYLLDCTPSLHALDGEALASHGPARACMSAGCRNSCRVSHHSALQGCILASSLSNAETHYTSSTRATSPKETIDATTAQNGPDSAHLQSARVDASRARTFLLTPKQECTPSRMVVRSQWIVAERLKRGYALREVRS